MVEEELHRKRDQLTTSAHHLIACFGGFMIAYSIFVRSTGLASAMTLNLVSLVEAIFGRSYFEIFLRFLGLLIYMSAGVLFAILKRSEKINIQQLSVGINMIAVILMIVMPNDMNAIIAMYPLFFALCFQYNAFPGCYGYGASTIFSSNNVRQVSVSLGEYIFDHNPAYLRRAAFFAQTILAFHLGVAAAYVLGHYLGTMAALFGIVILLPVTQICSKGEELDQFIEKLEVHAA